MIYVVQCRSRGEPRAWFAYDEDDLEIKVVAEDASPSWVIYDEVTPRQLLEALGFDAHDSSARTACPAVCLLADQHGWDAVLCRADFLLGQGVLSAEKVDRRAALLAAMQAEDGECRIYWSDPEAVLATEGGDAWLCAPQRWRARHVLHQQLVALEVLADNL